MGKNNIWLISLAVVAVLALMAKYLYQKPKFIRGESAPDFEAQLLSGSSAKLSSLRGKPVLLQFWGSWCGPCRAENPHLAELYKKYGPKGFEIFSVAIEQREAAWRAAVQKDGMVWPYQTAEFSEDLQFFKGRIVELYKVRSIPQTYLLDASGGIVGVNLSPAELDKKLAEMMAK